MDIQVLRIQAGNGKGLFRLGQAYYYLGKADLALSNLEQATKALPDDATSNI